NVLDEHRASQSAVAPPELPAGGRGPRGEVRPSVKAAQPGRVEVFGVLENDGAPGRAIAAPELVVVGAEEERAVHVGQRGREGAGGPDADVLHEDGHVVGTNR